MQCFPLRVVPPGQGRHQRRLSVPSLGRRKLLSDFWKQWSWHETWGPYKENQAIRRKLTVQELLREFGDSRKFQPNSVSLGHFRDQVVVSSEELWQLFRIWVAYVKGWVGTYQLIISRETWLFIGWFPGWKRELTAVYGDYGYTVKNILSTILITWQNIV